MEISTIVVKKVYDTGILGIFKQFVKMLYC
jgi:hypothetical protein